MLKTSGLGVRWNSCGIITVQNLRKFQSNSAINYGDHQTRRLLSSLRSSRNKPPTYFNNPHEKPMTIHELHNGNQHHQSLGNGSHSPSGGDQNQQHLQHYQLSQLNRHPSHLHHQQQQYHHQNINSQTSSSRTSSVTDRAFTVVIAVALLGSLSSFFGLYLTNKELEKEKLQNKKYLTAFQEVKNSHIQDLKKFKSDKDLYTANTFANQSLMTFHIALLEKKLEENKIETVSNAELFKLAEENFEIVRSNGHQTLNLKGVSSYSRLVPNTLIYTLYKGKLLTALQKKENEKKDK